MKDYKKLYLKYKTKYLMAKNGNMIHLDDIMRETLEIYNLVASYYDEVYIGGSMGIIALAYFIDKTIIPRDYPIPGDIDMVVHMEGRKPKITNRKIGEFSRFQKTDESSATFNREGENYFNSFDLIGSTRYVRHHIINHLGHEIKILSLNEIKSEYIENLDTSEKKENDLRKIDLISKLERYELNTEITEKLVPMTAIKSRGRRLDFSPDSSVRVDLATDMRFKDTPFASNIAKSLFTDSDSESEELEMPSIVRKKLSF